MPRRPAITTQADIARALRALRAAGMQNEMQVEVRTDGAIVIRQREVSRAPSLVPADESDGSDIEL